MVTSEPDFQCKEKKTLVTSYSQYGLNLIKSASPLVYLISDIPIGWYRTSDRKMAAVFACRRVSESQGSRLIFTFSLIGLLYHFISLCTNRVDPLWWDRGWHQIWKEFSLADKLLFRPSLRSMPVFSQNGLYLRKCPSSLLSPRKRLRAPFMIILNPLDSYCYFFTWRWWNMTL